MLAGMPKTEQYETWDLGRTVGGFCFGPEEVGVPGRNSWLAGGVVEGSPERRRI
jgi:hypothetical protein